MPNPRLTRRDALKVGAFGAAAVALPFAATLHAASASKIAASKLPKPYTVPFDAPDPAVGTVTTAHGGATFYRLEQKLATPEIIPGFKTPLFGYNGLVPGPTIIVNQNERVVVRQVNSLPENHPALAYRDWTSTHLHGSPSKPQYDGYASDITQPGEWKDYVYENTMNARTLWYHDHGVHHTAENAYMGLAAMYIAYDPVERGLPLPKGYKKYDWPLILSDKAFAADGSLLMDDRGHSGIYGDVVLVNGRPWPTQKVQRRKYRYRVLNASTGRSYRLALSDASSFQVIATDGGLMQAPQTITDFRIGMAERYEIVIDFAKYQAGTRVQLVNKGLPNSPNFDNTDKVMQFEVVADPPEDLANNAVPDVLFPGTPAMDLTRGQVKRELQVTRDNGIWTLGGLTWDQVVESEYDKVFANPQPGTTGVTEQWTIVNRSGGWFHPVHIHLVDFKIVARDGKPPHPYEKGPKDVVYVGENERVDLLMRFRPEDHGRYMIHCHNLSHEDHDMMTQFRVGDEKPVRADADHPELGAHFTDGDPFLDDDGEQVACDVDDPIFAAHPCAHGETEV
ncbi:MULTISPECIES: multicopper oxidase family protein [unclassified Geodermatophilus]|uniref:multicopper oxidase family protein n=1 Tax=unclassified Geodermatophilus TaxID=2637632 RepID=UPI003EEC93FF